VHIETHVAVPVTDGVEVTLVVKVLPLESVVVTAMTTGVAPDEADGRRALMLDSRAAI
jgi:hypothetical protein